MLRSKSRSGYLEFGQKKHSSFLSRSISGSKICRGDALVSQVDKEALVSLDPNSRKSISLSENRIVKAALMQKQMSNLEEELKNTKERLDAAEGERNKALNELKEAKEMANDAMTRLSQGLSPKKAEQVFADLESLKNSLSNSRKEMDSFHIKLAEKEASLEEMRKQLLESQSLLSKSKKRVQELEYEVDKAKQSESNMLESLMLQTRQIEQTKMDLEESKLEIVNLHDKLEMLKKGTKNDHNHRGFAKESTVNHVQDSEKIALKEEIAKLKSELKFSTQAEEKSKKAMDDLASALKEVATEASMANEKVTHLKEETEQLKKTLRTTEDTYKKQIDQLKTEVEDEKNMSDRLRVEAEESLLAWNGKEMGFISCIKKADEESALAKHENNRLKEALVAAENSTRIAREETYKLRDILKQALNESNVAKEASSIARAENSEIKDLLAEKEEAVHFLTKENERLRINEVAARENIKEFKRLLAANAEVKPFDDKEQGDVFNSPLSSLYEEHLDGRTTPQQTFSYDLDDLKVFNKDNEEEIVSDIVVNEDPEKAEALKGSIFDTSDSPTSEPRTPRAKSHHRRASSVYTDTTGTAQSEETENVHSSSSGHTEDSFYSKRRLFRKIGELIIGKPTSKKDAPNEPAKEQAKEPAKEQTKEQAT